MVMTSRCKGTSQSTPPTTSRIANATPPKRADALDARDQVLTAIRNALLANGIDLPSSTQQILFHDQTEDADGDRTRQHEGWPAAPISAPASRKLSDAVRALHGRPYSPEGPDP